MDKVGFLAGDEASSWNSGLSRKKEIAHWDEKIRDVSTSDLAGGSSNNQLEMTLIIDLRHIVSRGRYELGEANQSFNKQKWPCVRIALHCY